MYQAIDNKWVLLLSKVRCSVCYLCATRTTQPTTQCYSQRLIVSLICSKHLGHAFRRCFFCAPKSCMHGSKWKINFQLSIAARVDLAVIFQLQGYDTTSGSSVIATDALSIQKKFLVPWYASQPLILEGLGYRFGYRCMVSRTIQGDFVKGPSQLLISHANSFTATGTKLAYPSGPYKQLWSEGWL